MRHYFLSRNEKKSQDLKKMSGFKLSQIWAPKSFTISSRNRDKLDRFDFRQHFYSQFTIAYNSQTFLIDQ